MSTVRLRRPIQRDCERCSRAEAWDEETGSWRIEASDTVGDPFCIHEWDIDGTFRPYE
ncbi:HEWD family protein [Natronorarus salvus]|uniref:HEWD family protein n=1 Tax=Natronorarus salvus TaxID=3117733 RepID=UPI002F2688DC